MNGLDLTFGGALDNLPEGVDKSKVFETLLNDELAAKRKNENTGEFRELIDFASDPARRQQVRPHAQWQARRRPHL